MKPSQLRWKWLLFGLLAALVLVIALIPWLIGDTSRFGDRVAAELSAWTGGEVKFTGPVRVSFLPDVSVRGRIELEDSKRLPAVQSIAAREAKISLDLVDLLRGRITIDALRLLKPHITLRDSAMAMATPADTQTLFTTLLGGAPVRVLHVRKGRIMLPGKRGGTIKEIYAHLDAGKETGAVSGFGSFAYKDATVRYSLESGSVTTTGGAESFPVALTLTSRPFRARLSGTASNTAGFTIDGDMQAEIDDGRRFFKMDRQPHSRRRQSERASRRRELPILPDRRSPSTTGRSRSTATRPSACLRSPRRSRGRAWKERSPSIAWCSIPISAAPSRARASSPGRNSDAPFPFNRPLLQFIDADLRISAAAIDAGALKLGRGGFTITAKQGSVASEVGELELCGGSADGRLNVDLAQAKKQITLVADLAGIDFDACLRAARARAPDQRHRQTSRPSLRAMGTDFSQLTGNLCRNAQSRGQGRRGAGRLCAACHRIDPDQRRRAGAVTRSRRSISSTPIASSAAAISGVSP